MTILTAAAAVAATVAEAAAAVGAGVMSSLPAAEGAAAAAAGTSAAATAGSAAAAGVGGLSAGAGGVAGSIGAGIGGAAQGAALGAGLGAGTSAITGGDPGQGALMGAATGAIGGGLTSGIGEIGTGMGEAGTAGNDLGVSAGDTSARTGIAAPADTSFTPSNVTPIGTDGLPAGTNSVLANSPTPLQQGIAQGSQAANPGAFTNPAADELAAAAPGGEPSIYQPMTQEASANLAKQEAMVGSHAGDEGGILQATKTFEPNVPVTESVGTPVPKPNISGYVKQGANWLKDNPEKAMIGGAVLLPMMSGGGGSNNGTPYQADNTNYLSPNFQRSVPQGYDPAKGYANGGGIVSGIPGAGIYKDAFGSTIGQVVPGLGDELFGSNAPAAKPMNPIVARALQAQQAQGAQPAQGMQPATQAQPMQMTPPAPQQPQQTQVATQTAANGGILQVDGHLGGYAHGGIPRLLSGAGDGVSDSIPATIAGKEPARLANNEFVIPARIVSELGNGSSEAGGKILQAMVDRIQAKRKKSIGKGKIAVDSKAYKDLPA